MVLEVVHPIVGKEGEELEVELPFEGKEEEEPAEVDEELELVLLVVG